LYYDVCSLTLTSLVSHLLVPHNTTHNPDSPLPHPTPPLYPSTMSLTPSKSSDESSINSIGPNKELPDFTDIARDIQNRASCQVGSETTEARLFREFFGTSVRVVEILWQLVVHNKLRPRGGCLEHLLWMLYFLKVYPKQGLGCSVVGASAGAVDPKTHCKWVWAYIEAIAKLVDVVMSLLYCFAFFY
jgi:hypothetical protein